MIGRQRVRLIFALIPQLNATGRTWRTPKLPEWGIEAIRDASPIESSLSGVAINARAIPPAMLPRSEAAGQAYFSLLATIGHLGPISHFIIAPWLKTGGSDLNTLRIIEELVALGESPTLAVTEDDNGDWMDRVPDSVPLIRLATRLSALSVAERIAVLSRLLIQLEPERIHIINSDLGWRTLQANPLAMSNLASIYASLYCDEYDADVRPFGYARWYLRDCAPYLDGVLIDNHHYLQVWSRELGVHETLFHPVPTFIPFHAREATGHAGGAVKVLWMGRAVPQKQPQLLIELARRMPEIQFIAYGIDETEARQIDRKLPLNLRLMGGGSTFAELEVAEFDCFVNTSAWDGLPMVIKEAINARLPVVTSSVGGIPELINHETGYPVSNPADVDSYVHAIREVLSDRGSAMSKASSAFDYQESKHSRQAMHQALQEIPGYLEPGK